MTVEKMRLVLELVLLAVCLVLLFQRQSQCETINDLTDEVNKLTLANMHRIAPGGPR